MPGQQPGVRLAHAADAQGIDEPLEADGSPLLDRSEQGGDGLGLPALPQQQRVPMLGQAKDVGRRVQPAERKKFRNGLVA